MECICKNEGRIVLCYICREYKNVMWDNHGEAQANCKVHSHNLFPVSDITICYECVRLGWRICVPECSCVSVVYIRNSKNNEFFQIEL